MLFLNNEFTEADKVFKESLRHDFTVEELNSVQFRPPDPKNIHNRVAIYLKKAGVLKNGTITGAIPGGPLEAKEWEAKWKHLFPKDEDIYAEFQTSECVYYDHSKAYPTNEPCIYGSSEAILFFSFYIRYFFNTNS